MATSSAGPPGGPDFPGIMTVFACELNMLSAVLTKALSAIFLEPNQLFLVRLCEYGRQGTGHF